MELRHLEAFVAVAEELNFSRAAERLQMAQSPLSQRIQSLEAELGVRLFERTNRRVTVTDAGRRLLPEARATLRGAGATRRAAERVRRGESGTVRLAFVASAAFLGLPELLRAVTAAAPEAEPRLARLNSAAQAEALVADELDLGLARTLPAGAPEQIGSLPLAGEPMLAVLPAEHPLAARDRLALSALADEPWILSGPTASPRSVLIDHITQMCAAAGFAPSVAHVAPDLPSVLGPVAGGLGVSLVPLGIARLRVPGVAAIPLARGDQRSLPSTLLWHRERERPLVDRILEAAATPGRSRRAAGSGG